MTSEDLERIRNRKLEHEMIRLWTGKLSGKSNREMKLIHNEYLWEQKYNVYSGEILSHTEIEDSYRRGVLRKEALMDAVYYWGICRNARVARWSTKHQLFFYQRYKFGSQEKDKIPHPENQRVEELSPGRPTGLDVFVPWCEVEPLDFERVEIPEKSVE